MRNNSYIISSNIGGIGNNTLWPSYLPEDGKIEKTHTHSFLANGGTTIQTPTQFTSFKANPTFYQMSRHDADHFNRSYLPHLINPSTDSEPIIFDTSMTGEVGADFFDHVMESVRTIKRNTPESDQFSIFNAKQNKWQPLSQSLEQLASNKTNHFLMIPIEMHPDNLKPENLVAYTVWDKLYDNLHKKLGLIPLYCTNFPTEEALHVYSENAFPADIKNLIEGHGPSQNLTDIQTMFTKEYNGLNIDYQAYFVAAQNVIAQWKQLIELDKPIKTDTHLIFPRHEKTGLLEELYSISESADTSLKCPVEKSTVKLKSKFYLEGFDFYEQGNQILEAVINRLKSIGYDKKQNINLLNSPKELEGFALMKILNFFGEISYGFSIIPKK